VSGALNVEQQPNEDSFTDETSHTFSESGEPLGTKPTGEDGSMGIWSGERRKRRFQCLRGHIINHFVHHTHILGFTGTSFRYREAVLARGGDAANWDG
jgi:hypothetical protein